MEKEMIYSFVVPAYNEEKNIPIIYNKIISLMNPISEKWELIFIDDGSDDNSFIILKKLSEKDKRVKFLSLSRNFGHQAALTAGLDYAKGNAIISLDCDLQDPPEVIKKMIDKHNQGYDIVYARRKNYRNDNILKKFLSKTYYSLLYTFSDTKIPKNVGDFRLIDRKVLDALKGMKEKSRYLRGMVAWLGFKYTFVDYKRPDRINGKSHYNLRKLFNLGLEGVLNFSTAPLKAGFLLGLLSIITGSIFLIYMIADTLAKGVYYHLYKWLAVILLIFAGIQFMFLWILGEYIWRTYNDVRDRPIYVVNYKHNLDP